LTTAIRAFIDVYQSSGLALIPGEPAACLCPTARFQRKEGISNRSLCEAIDRAERGLIDADLGQGLIKQRVARPGEGRSGGYRTIVATQMASVRCSCLALRKALRRT
jgi:hypothetical protein